MLFQTDEGPLEFTPSRVVVAGWTGRDAAAVQHHIDELAELGVAPPSTYPLYYRVSAALVSQTNRIDVVGAETSGEVEVALFRSGGRLWMTVGSDHTDRALEATSVALSKQICAKPVGTAAWSFETVGDLDALRLEAWIEEGGAEVKYMDGALAAVRPLAELMDGAGLAEGELMFCGAITAIGGVRPSTRFRMALTDPATGRVIEHAYDVNVLPLIS